MAVPVAGREVHFCHAGAVAQGLVNQAHTFEEVGPVRGREKAHARDDVTHRRVVGDLLLMLDVDEASVVPSRAIRASHSSAGVTAGSCSRSLWASATAKACEKGACSSISNIAAGSGLSAPPIPRSASATASARSRAAPARRYPLGQAPKVLDEHDAQ